MKKPSKTIIIASVSICAILVAVLIYTAIKYVKKNKEDKEEALPSSTTTTTTTTTTTSNKIAYGDKGENVKKLQSYLNAQLLFYYYEKGGRPIYNGATINSLDVDGIYGKKTKCVCEWWFGKSTVTLNDLK